MLQNYKIFRDDFCIRLLESFQISGDPGAGSCLRVTTDKDLEELAVLLQRPLSSDLSVEAVQGAARAFKGLKKHFRYIQAAGGIVSDPEGRILLIRRRGMWDLPKGKKEKQETRSQAALREVREETGLGDLVILEKLSPTYHIYSLNKKPALKKTWWYHMSSKGGPLIPQIEEAITQAVWKEPAEARRLVGESYASLHDLMMSHPLLFPES